MLAVALQKSVEGVVEAVTRQENKLNAETVTAIATSFLKRIGNKGGLKPKRVSLEGGIYLVEVEMKKSPLLFALTLRQKKLPSMRFNKRGRKPL